MGENVESIIPSHEHEDHDSNENLSDDEDIDVFKIDDEIDFKRIEFVSLSESDLKLYHFSSRKMAFEFYNAYAEKRGFAGRKWNTVKNIQGVVSQQTFVCYKQGYRLDKHLKRTDRKKEPRAMTRFGCDAFFRVWLLTDTGRWHVKALSNDHSHEMLAPQFVGMFPAHRKMDECELMQMNTMRDAGIGVTQIYGLVVNQSGGYERKLQSRDSNMFWRHTVDAEAFDATYRRNKYMCPLVVFAGVNHHNQTIVFGSGLIANETEETNATSNISNPRFTSKFRWCMLGDYDVARFRSKWDELVSEFDLHGNQWVRDLYEKRKMWATTHIRGNFFAGFRTTSRCEGMHSQVGRYVHYRNNLTEFLKHFSRYLAYIRQRDVEADFESIIGDPVLQTTFEAIERDAAKFYTGKVFLLFRPVLERASGVKVVSCEQTPNCLRYVVTSKRSRQARQWFVSVEPSALEFKCSCLQMESMGIPCEHIVVLLHYLEINELPAGRSDPNLDLSKEVVRELLSKLRYSCIPSVGETLNENDGADEDGGVRDPARVRTKGCGSRHTNGSVKVTRRTTCCSICQRPGHNKKTCPRRGAEGNGGTSTIMEEG
ncbi:Zinc finger, SWIM-type [Sesbania bispinosa]|nr:Zinc finger, SWIM-type [Sesbania bispinosa]